MIFCPLPAPVCLPPSLCHPRCQLRGFSPLGQCFHSRGINALQQLDSHSHSLVVPPQGFPPLRRPHGLLLPPHSGGLTDLPLSSHSIGLSRRFSCQPAPLYLAAVFSPSRPPAPVLSAATMAASLVLPLMDIAPPCLPYAPFYADPPPLLSAVVWMPPPPLQLQHLPPMPTPPYPLPPTWRFCLCSPPCCYR